MQDPNDDSATFWQGVADIVRDETEAAINERTVAQQLADDAVALLAHGAADAVGFVAGLGAGALDLTMTAGPFFLAAALPIAANGGRLEGDACYMAAGCLAVGAIVTSKLDATGHATKVGEAVAHDVSHALRDAYDAAAAPLTIEEWVAAKNISDAASETVQYDPTLGFAVRSDAMYSTQ